MADNLTNKLDLVDRGAIIEKLLDMHFYPAIVKSVIEKAPAVDAEEKRGHWIFDKFDYHACKCSICGTGGSISSSWWQMSRGRYCPGCGATMDEEEDNE